MPGKNPTRNAKGSEPPWSLKDIQQLIDVLIEREITEFEMEKGGVRIRIKRGDAQAGTPALAAPPFPLPRSEMSRPADTEAPPAVGSEGESTEGLYIIKSPIVGTFYAAPAPNAPPFVKLGDVVQVGQVLCVIEAMKLMNEIESEAAGEIVRIYAESGQPVEYGQSLFAIKPSHKK